MSKQPVVVKFGGELLDDSARLAVVVSGIRAAVMRGTPLVIVHGAGKEIDRALEAAGVPKRQIDGLRITDEPTLDVVVAVVAGTVNTRLVAALAAAGVRAVGLTGADGPCGLCEPALPHRAVDGRIVHLGRVGMPVDGADTGIITALVDQRFVPVVACIGIARDGALLNVNADTLAGHLAARLGASRFAIAGTTAGVIGADGSTAAVLDMSAIERLIADGTATAGMIAKLRACEHAIAAGVGDVVILDGRDEAALEAATSGGIPPRSTRIVPTLARAR
jgi:acetylglutamate kinase